MKKSAHFGSFFRKIELKCRSTICFKMSQDEQKKNLKVRKFEYLDKTSRFRPDSFLFPFFLFALKNMKNLQGQNVRMVVLKAHKGLANMIDPTQNFASSNIFPKIELNLVPTELQLFLI